MQLLPWNSSIQSIKESSSKYKGKGSLNLMDQYEIVSSLPYFHHWNILKSYYMKMDDFFLTMETPQERSKKLPHSLWS